MSILVDALTRVIIQGITGSMGRQFADRMLAAGTLLVGGVTPGRGGEHVRGLPVFDTVAEARRATGATASFVVVPPLAVEGALTESIGAGIEVAVSYTEHVPAHTALRVVERAAGTATRILGPNSAGLVSPGGANLSDISDENIPRGRVGVVSKSGTLTYEVLDALTRSGLGASTVVCLGGDPVIGTDHAEVMSLFIDDPDTDCILLIGEIGGRSEIHAAGVWQERECTKPLVAYIAGHAAPPGRRMGHAGAIVAGDADSAAAKSRALRELGVRVVDLVTDVGDAARDALRETGA